LHNHNPWLDEDVPDPDDDDPEDFLPRGNGRSIHFTHTFQTFRSPRGGPAESDGRPPEPNDPANVIREFQEMIGQIMGPGLRQGQSGRSGPDALFSRGERDPFPNPRHSPFQEEAGDEPNLFAGSRRGAFVSGIAGGPGGPHIIGQRITFTTGRRPRDGADAQNPAVDDLATYAPPDSSRSPRGPSFIVISITARPDQLARILGGLFGTMGVLGPLPQRDGAQNAPNAERSGLPPGLQGLFASLFNPANAVAGDAVYSQEALDRIISTLMEQHPTSNAPGPASEEAIASLPKKMLDEQMLGPELKAECSVCMDDVHLHDEVVVLPCTHWFHEVCARAWLCEHNTCPICRKGISGDQGSRNESENRPQESTATETRTTRRADLAANLAARHHSRNEARLSAIRDRGRLSPSQEGSTRRHQFVGGTNISRDHSISPTTLPGAHSSSFQHHDSEPSESQRVSRRTTSSSDRSQRSSGSRTGGSDNSSGPMSWFRRFSGGGRRND
jgi:E3 ubiquitin-protein ligase RNF115/126